MAADRVDLRIPADQEQLIERAAAHGQSLSEFLRVAAGADALEDEARASCLRFGFRAPLDDPRHLFRGLKAVRKLGFEPPGQRP